MSASVAIFTDLDGTLIRHQDYAFDAVETLLLELQGRQVPVILASSKTRAEIEFYRKRMQLTDPFIVENGGAIFIPKGYFPEVFLRSGKARFRTCGDYDCLKLGRPYKDLIRTLVEIQTEAGISLIGFHQMDEDEIIRETGLDRMQARLAARREYDEPFLIRGNVSRAQTRRLKSLAAQRSCMIVQGGRFYHLTGKSDKGRAVRTLMRLYRAARETQIFLGLGDSENDLSLLRSVDVSILMAKPDGSFDPEVLKRIPDIRRAPAGPEGWRQSVNPLLEDQTS